MTPIVAVSGPSGVGKTRLLARLVRALSARGLRVAILKHTGHDHPFDRRGKDTEVLRRAGAIAAAIEGPASMALFGPPAGGARALARLLPPADLVLAEGWKREPLPRLEVHRRRVSPEFLCARDRRVFAVVTDEPPPRAVPAFDADDVDGIVALLCARFGLPGARPGPERLPGARPVSSLAAEGSERTHALGRPRHMAKTTKRSAGTKRSGSRTSARRGGRSTRAKGSSRSAAARKGGTATLRARGPEFYSEIGRKGGKSRARRARATKRSTSRGATSRAGSRRGRKSTRRGTRSSGK